MPDRSIRILVAGIGTIEGMLLCLMFLLSVYNSSKAEEIDNNKALQVQSVYMYNFAKFVQWPERAFASDTAPLRIGIYRNKEMYSTARELLSDKTAQNRSMEFKHFVSYDESTKTELAQCHIVFISSDSETECRTITGALRTSGVLTVSHDPKFAVNGGMIEFYLKQNRIALRINHEVAQAANLKISSQILRLAEIVKTAKE